MPRKKKKAFVVDTNVILHDINFLEQFDDNDLIIPMIVMEELDNFKKGREVKHFNAREFARVLDSLPGDAVANGGVSLGKGRGKLRMRLGGKLSDVVRDNFSPKKADTYILNTAHQMCLENEKKKEYREIILLTKDVNLRGKAKGLGMKAMDYTADHIAPPEQLYSGITRVDSVSPDFISRLFKDKTLDCADVSGDIPNDTPLVQNQNFIFKNGSTSALASVIGKGKKLKVLTKSDCSCYGIEPRNVEQSFALNAMLDDDVHLVSITGKAGTGKTLLALAAALEKRRQFRQIFLSRPLVPLSNKDMGFLPGDIDSKMGPYMQPLYDNLGIIQNQFKETSQKYKQIKTFLEEEKLVISPLAYIRGRSLERVFFIVDEAQNLTPKEVKTIVTRAGEGTKIIFTGDIFQIDHPYIDSQSNGLSYLIEKMKNHHLYAHVNLEKGERSELAEVGAEML